ncbi:MAG TPA: TonB family protein [Xanthomonadaceae bacterium]
MQKLLLAAAVMAMPMGGVALAKQADDPTMSFVFRMSLDANGRITALDYTGKHGNDNPVAGKLEQMIRSWDFTPGKIDGAPTPTDTTLTVRAVLRKSSGDGIELGIVDAHTGAAAEKLLQPGYPSRELSSVIEARLIVVAAVGANGKVTKVEFAGISPMNESNRKAFEAAVVEASKEWRFRPETVGGHPVAARVSLPVDFCLVTSPCARVKDEALAKDGTLPQSTPVALDSQVTLVTQVAGTTP